MAHRRPKGKARVSALSLTRVIPDHQRQQINECVASARAEGRSRTFVHAAIISTDIRVVVKHPNELERVLGGDEITRRETDEIITNQELSRLTLCYEKVYKNFYRVKTCLDELEISHYVIRRNLSIGEFDIIQYEEDNSIVLERRHRGLIERFFGDGKDIVPVTALIIVADFLMPFVSDSVVNSPRSAHRTRTQSAVSLTRHCTKPNVMYDIDLGKNPKTNPVSTGSQTDRSHLYRCHTVTMSDDDASVSTKRISFSRHNSIRNMTITRTRSNGDIRKRD